MSLEQINAEPTKKNKEHLLRILVWVVLLLGFAIRLTAWLQNKNLLAGEATLANGIYNTGTGLLLNAPGAGTEYAPPLFVFITRLLAATFGYSEISLRLFPLLSGTVSLFLLYSILKKFLSLRSFWYSLLLMATSYALVLYTTELRYFIADVAASLGLMLLAFRLDIRTHHKTRFVAIWITAGIVATWLSASAVFSLLGVASYYIARCKEYHRFSRLKMLSIVVAGWLLQFIIFYLLALQPWVMSKGGLYGSDFLNLVINGGSGWLANVQAFAGFFTSSGDSNVFTFLFNGLLLVPGMFILANRHFAKFLLVLVPVISALLFSVLQLYPFTPGTMLFALPGLFIFIGYGFEKVMQLRQPALRLAFVSLALVSVFFNNLINAMMQPADREQILMAIHYLQKKNIDRGEQVYVHHYAVPAYIYYTQIHNDGRMAKYKNAHFLDVGTDYNSLAASIKNRVAFVYTRISGEELISRQYSLETYLPLVAWYKKDGAQVFVYEK